MKKRFFFPLLSLSLPNSSPLLHHISPVRFLVVRKIESANALTALRKFDFLPWAKIITIIVIVRASNHSITKYSCGTQYDRTVKVNLCACEKERDGDARASKWKPKNYFHLNDIWSFVYSEQRAYIVKSPCKMREMSYRYISIVLNIYQTRWSEPQWKIITKQCRIHHYYYYWSFWALVRFFLLIRRLPRPCEPITNNA